MYDTVSCPCDKFEKILSKHVCVMAQDMKKSKKRVTTTVSQPKGHLHTTYQPERGPLLVEYGRRAVNAPSFFTAMFKACWDMPLHIKPTKI